MASDERLMFESANSANVYVCTDNDDYVMQYCKLTLTLYLT